MYDSRSETASLLSSGSGGGGDDNKNENGRKSNKVQPLSSTGLMINRILIILLLAGLVIISIRFQSFQSQLTEKLSTDEKKIKTLEDTVVAQSKIIDRFNESVTNADVLHKFEVMEKSWEEERTDIFNQLNQTKIEVGKELNSTMIELGETVTKANKDIEGQVHIVTKNFDQYAVKTENQFSLANDYMIYQVAMTFTILSCLISMWHMGSHTRKLNKPTIQRKILAILWMCPIYAVTSSLSLVFPKYSGYLGIIKDSYEAYIIYQFLSFCISVIGGGDRNKTIDIIAKKADKLTPPFQFFVCCCKAHYENDRALASAILTQCQAFTMQFIFWKPVVSIASFLCKKYRYYGPYATTATDWKSIQTVLNVIQNLSIFFAFAGLMKFYHAVDKELEWCRPFPKFLCIKGVVFVTFWQSMVLKILAETTDMGGDGDSADSWSEQTQNFLICLEMLLFSIAHFYCFPVEEWQPGYKANFRKAKFGETMALNDFFSDLKIIMTASAEKNSKKLKKMKKSMTPKESTILEEEGGESETEDGSVRSGLTRDEEDPVGEAFVRALTGSVRYCSDNEDDQSSTKPTVQEAQQHLGDMLDDMLFNPRCSTPCSIGSNSIGRTRMDESGLEEEESQNKINNESEEAEICNDEECGDAEETTGLLTREESASYSANNLRPSIFTSISQQQSREEDVVVEDEKEEDLGDDNNLNPNEFNTILEEDQKAFGEIVKS